MTFALDDDDVRAVLGAALSGGAEFAELYAEQRRGRSVRLDDKRVQDLTSGRDRGAGIRVQTGNQTAYAYTNMLTRDALVEAAKVAAAGVKGSAQTTVADLTDQVAEVTHPAAKNPFDVDGRGLVDIVREAEDAAWSVSGDVRQVTVIWADTGQDVFIVNSEGVRVTERRVRTRIVAQVVAARDGMIQTGYFGPGASVGMELLDRYSAATVGRKAAEQAVELLGARPSPAGELPVILAAGSGGVLFHEACGHGMEADIVAKQASVYAGRQGEQIGTALLTGVDDATDLGAWGSYSFDDEGTPAQRTVLFDKGVCTDYLSDRLRSTELSIPRSGNGRRQSYAHLPIPRMSNSYILPGDADPAEIVRGVTRGLYCDDLGGGQVDPASGDFVFGVSQAHMISNGEITYPVRGANLVGDGPTVIGRITAVGTDFDVRQGVCGKDGQGVPAGLGNPTLLIDRITVGGTG